MTLRTVDRRTSTLHIRNMVCDRCRTAVERLLDELGLAHREVHLGKVELESELEPRQRSALVGRLENLGFELIDDKHARIIERSKQFITGVARGTAGGYRKEKLSTMVSRQMGMEYSGLSKLFSTVVGISIERYFNLQRIERAKELLVYDELSVSQIADLLGYSSVHHLSNQFNQFVGHSASHFRLLGAEKRKALDRVHEG